MKKILISIIVPVYNGEPYLERFFNAIINQKYENYELIVIDDGSVDNSKKIIVKYASQCDKIVPIFKENEGVSISRNIGIKKARGEFIYFADCDDYMSNDFFKKIIPKLNGNFDILIFNAYEENNNHIFKKILNLKNEIIFLKPFEGVKKYLIGEFSDKFLGAPWNKIYRKEIIDINKINFLENKRIGEDLLFNIEYFLHIRTIKTINERLYYYCFNLSSASRKKYKSYAVEDLFKYIYPLEKLINKKMDNKEEYIGYFLLNRFFFIIDNESHSNTYKFGKSNINTYFQNKIIIKYFNTCKFSKLSLKQKIYYICYKLKFYKIIYTVLFLKNRF